MPRFFIPGAYMPGDLITLDGGDARHIGGSLRMKQGQELALCGAGGVEYQCVIEHIDRDSVAARVARCSPCTSEPTVRVNLFVALAKSDKLEHVVQKAVELGAFSLTPFLSERCVCRSDASGFEKKRQRLIKIAEEAAKQCGRGLIPEILPLCGFADAVKAASASDIPLFLYENETELHLREALGSREFASVSLMTGPEGGFAAAEADAALNAGLLSVSLGSRILRCETAPLAALAAIMYHSGNF